MQLIRVKSETELYTPAVSKRDESLVRRVQIRVLKPQRETVRVRTLGWNQNALIAVQSCVATATAVCIYGVSSPVVMGGLAGAFIADCVIPVGDDFSMCTLGKEQASRVEKNPVLEMKSARRSLSEKAREEMSEFDREYPW